MRFGLLIIMGIALALLLAPWVNAKHCYYFELSDAASYMGILMSCEEDYCYMSIHEEANGSLISSKGCMWPNYPEQEQSFTYLRMTYYTLTMDGWPGELWDFESPDQDQNSTETALPAVITGEVLIGMLWLLL